MTKELILGDNYLPLFSSPFERRCNPFCFLLLGTSTVDNLSLNKLISGYAREVSPALMSRLLTPSIPTVAFLLSGLKKFENIEKL